MKTREFFSQAGRHHELMTFVFSSDIFYFTDVSVFSHFISIVDFVKCPSLPQPIAVFALPVVRFL